MSISSKNDLSREMAKKLYQCLNSIYEFQFSIDTDDNKIAKYMLGNQRHNSHKF